MLNLIFYFIENMLVCETTVETIYGQSCVALVVRWSKYPVLKLDGQNQIAAIVIWLKIDFSFWMWNLNFFYQTVSTILFAISAK